VDFASGKTRPFSQV